MCFEPVPIGNGAKELAFTVIEMKNFIGSSKENDNTDLGHTSFPWKLESKFNAPICSFKFFLLTERNKNSNFSKGFGFFD